MKQKKVCQCRYCPNSSDEGDGLYQAMDETKWICRPCFDKFNINRGMDKFKKVAMQGKQGKGGSNLGLGLIALHKTKKKKKKEMISFPTSRGKVSFEKRDKK